MSPNVSCAVTGRIVVVTLQKEPYNICNQSFYSEIAAEFEAISAREDISCVVLTSGLEVFSAGGELQEIQSLGAMTGQEADQAVSQCTRCMSAIYGCRYPVIAAVNGKAIGAGAAMSACCDIAIASENASFSVPEVAVGFIGASEFLQLILPTRLARYYYFTGRPISASEVRHHGGLLEVVPAEKLMNRAMEIADELCRISPLALRYAKKALNENDKAKLVDKYLNEFRHTLEFARSNDYKEAIQAMIDHRPPAFTGT